MELLRGVNLTHAFEYTLFENINITLHNRESIAILGVSGCGKSTMLHILSTLLKPNSGEVFYNEREIYSLSSDERLKIRRNDFGIIFQSHYLFKGFSAYENIELAAKLVNKKIDNEILDKLQISQILKQKIGELSGGQQQRVSIARVLHKNPNIIFADEPTGNLDSKTSADVLGLLKRTSGEFNQTIVMITHNNEIAQLADRIVRIEDGKIVG